MDAIISLFSLNILPFLVILSVLVFVHEMGHYWVARYNGVKVETFSIGFGPELWGWTDKQNTRWKISLVPLGGYVKMYSDLNAASQPDQSKISEMTDLEKQGSLFHKTVWQRMAVSFGGPFANYVLAVVVLSGLYVTVGQRVPAMEAKIGSVALNSPASIAGLKTDDVITSIDGQLITTFSEMQTIVSHSPGKSLELKVKRNQEDVIFTVTPQLKTMGGAQIGMLGVSQGTDEIKIPVYQAPLNAAITCYDVSAQTVKSLWGVLTGQTSADGLSGPIGIASIVGQAASQNWVELIWLSAFLSISLGLINLFPIPMLDGGHLLFYAIEAIRGKPVSDKAQEIAFQIGFAIVATLMIVATWNDLSRLKIFEWVKSLV